MRALTSIVLGCILASAASAAMKVQMDVASGGHPYLATVLEGPICNYEVGFQFATFCLEKNEYFNPGSSYDVTLSMSAEQGGQGGPNPDPIDIKTAWIYDSFLDGNLGGYTAGQVQHVIWYVEQEISSLNSTEQALLAAATTGSAAWGTDFHGVMVMNLSGSGRQYAQSQLIRCEPSGGTIPVPGAALLGMLGLSVIARFRR